MSADRGAGPRVAREILPVWLFAALGAWVLVAAAALANSTTIPVRADVVAALIGAAAVAHGLLWHRWRVAAPVAVLALGLALALGLDLVPGFALSEEDGVVHRSGPADSVGVRMLWVAATIISGLVIAWGMWLHVRFLARTREDWSRHDEAGQLARSDADIRQHVHQVERRLSAIEELLSPNPRSSRS